MAWLDTAFVDNIVLPNSTSYPGGVVVEIDSTHIGVAYTGTDNDGFFAIYSHNGSGDNLTLVGSALEYDTYHAYGNVTVRKMAAGVIIIVDVDLGPNCYANVISYNESTYALADEGRLQVETSMATSGAYVDFDVFDSNNLIVALVGGTDDYGKYISVSRSSYVLTEEDLVNYTTTANTGIYPKVVAMSSTIFAASYRNTSNYWTVETGSIDGSVDITIEDTWSDTYTYYGGIIAKVNSRIVAVLGRGGPYSWRYVRTFDLGASYDSISEVDNSGNVTNLGFVAGLHYNQGFQIIDEIFGFWCCTNVSSVYNMSLMIFTCDSDGDNVNLVEENITATDDADSSYAFPRKAIYDSNTGMIFTIWADILNSAELWSYSLDMNKLVETSDELLPKLSEVSDIIKQILKNTSDEILLTLEEVSDAQMTENFVSTSDGVLLVLGENSDAQLTGAFYNKSDELFVKLEDATDLLNINTLMNATVRQILGKVEITYSNPFEDEEIQISVANDTTNEKTDLYNLANSLTTPIYKYFNLHNNSLDGTFHPMPSAITSRNGWWGTTLSDASGEFTTDPVITFEFDAKTVTKLELYGDDKLNNYPVDFTFRLYSAGDVLEHTEPVTSNASNYWTTDVDESDIVKMTLTISKISQAYSTIKLYEVYTSIVEEYTGADLFSIELLEELEYESGSLAIGNVSSNELTVRLYNENDIFNPNNEDSPLNQYIKKNRRIQAWLGVEISPGYEEWHSLGVFWSSDWRVDDNSIEASVVGLDKLELLRKSDFSISQVYTDYTLKDLAEIVFADAGISSEEYSIDSALDVDTIPYAWFDKMSHRNALKEIAKAGLAVLYCNRDGIIVLERIDTSGTALFDFNEDNYFDKRQSTRTELINHIEVKAEPRIVGVEETVYEDYESFAIPAGESVTKTHFFNFVPVVDAQEPDITGGVDIVVDSYTAYAWGMDVTYKNNGGSEESVTEITIDGKKLDVSGGQVAIAEDEDSINDNGRQSMPSAVSSELIQTLEQAQDIADDLLTVYSDPYRNVRLAARGHIALKIGDIVTVPEFEDTPDYVIVRQHLLWDGALKANIDVQKTGG